VVSRRGQESGAGQLSAFSFQFSAFSFQFSVFSFQFSVRWKFTSSLPADCSSFIVHRSPCSLLPAPCSTNPIAALRTRSAAIELEPETLAMTKNPLKQASNAPGSLTGKVQLQR
jgi:hypothetical protein